MLNGIAANLESKGMSSVQAVHQAYARMDGLLMAQASAVAYKDIISVLALVILCLVPLVAIMKRPPRVGRDLPPAH
jgi:hypothetical protein